MKGRSSWRMGAPDESPAKISVAMTTSHRVLRTTRLPDLLLREHAFEVPLDHGLDPGLPLGSAAEERVTLFARECVAPERADDDLPWIVFLQGGPGFGAPRPMDRSGWIRRATEGHRVLLLDERGTGRSTPLTAQTLAPFGGEEAQAAVLARFRADSIVADCECVRKTLLGPDEPWTVLGQSFGGFCATRYLSAAPEGLRAALITGGLPPLAATADEIYSRTYPLVLERNARYYERYPDDVEHVRAVATRLERGDVRLPSGGPFTRRQLQLLGLLLGFSDGAELVHYLFEDAFVQGAEGEQLSTMFLRGFEAALHFQTNPLFAVLHEACYAQGSATNWAAERVRAQFPELDAESGPLRFTGEMIFPWMFEELQELRPLAGAAERLARRDDWPRLYDPERLASNQVPVAAAVYYDDMYVERAFSLETAAAIRGAEVWITNEFEHNGLRAQGERVLGSLLERVR